MKFLRGCCALLIALLAALLSPLNIPPLYAHGGGTPRLTNVPVGPYHLYAWSEPEPWRVGEVHLSLAVTKQNPEGNSSQIEIPVTDVDITVTFTPMINNAVDTSAEPVVITAERQAFLSDFYYEADPTLTREGDWQITVAVSGPDGSGSTEFMMETLPARAINWTLVAAGGGVLVFILVLIAIWSRAQQTAQPVNHRPHRGVRRVQRKSGGAARRKEAKQGVNPSNNPEAL